LKSTQSLPYTNKILSNKTLVAVFHQLKKLYHGIPAGFSFWVRLNEVMCDVLMIERMSQNDTEYSKTLQHLILLLPPNYRLSIYSCSQQITQVNKKYISRSYIQLTITDADSFKVETFVFSFCKFLGFFSVFFQVITNTLCKVLMCSVINRQMKYLAPSVINARISNKNLF